MNKEKIIKHLEGLADGSIKPRNPEHGLCDELFTVFDISLHSLVDVTRYPLFGGSRTFPVPSPDDSYTDVSFYLGMNDNCKWSGAYGDNRKHFCKWVAEELNNEQK